MSTDPFDDAPGWEPLSPTADARGWEPLSPMDDAPGWEPATPPIATGLSSGQQQVLSAARQLGRDVGFQKDIGRVRDFSTGKIAYRKPTEKELRLTAQAVMWNPKHFLPEERAGLLRLHQRYNTGVAETIGAALWRMTTRLPGVSRLPGQQAFIADYEARRGNEAENIALQLATDIVTFGGARKAAGTVLGRVAPGLAASTAGRVATQVATAQAVGTTITAAQVLGDPDLTLSQELTIIAKQSLFSAALGAAFGILGEIRYASASGHVKTAVTAARKQADLAARGKGNPVDLQDAMWRVTKATRRYPPTGVTRVAWEKQYQRAKGYHNAWLRQLKADPVPTASKARMAMDAVFGAPTRPVPGAPSTVEPTTALTVGGQPPTLGPAAPIAGVAVMPGQVQAAQRPVAPGTAPIPAQAERIAQTAPQPPVEALTEPQAPEGAPAPEIAATGQEAAVSEPAITPKQNRALHAVENELDLSPDTLRGLKREVSGGRTDTSKEFTQKEASQYIDTLRERGAELKQVEEQPTIAAERAKLPTAADIADPVLRQEFENIQTELDRKVVPIGDVFKGRRKYSAQVWDADRAFHDLTERSGIPFFQKHQQLQTTYRDNRFDAGEMVKGLFEGLPLSPRAIMGQPDAEKRIFDYLATGTEPPDLTPSERTIGNRMKAVFQHFEQLVKRERHSRWMTTGELPPDATTELMHMGQDILQTGDQAQYDAWLDSADFGVRDLYVPSHHKGTPNLRTLTLSRFGRGFTKTRDVERVQYDPNFPLIGDFYRYVLKALNIERLEPLAKEFETMFKESAVDMPLISRYFANLYGSLEELDIMQTILEKGMRHFYRVTIPQKIVKWSLRNLGQPTTISLPKVFEPTDPLFWKHSWKMFAGAVRYLGFTSDRFQISPQDREYFRRYVSSMDAARQHYFFEEFSEFDAPHLGRVMHVLDTITKFYSATDVTNRVNAFFYGLDFGRAALARYQSQPSARNWQRFLNGTGGQLAPLVEQQQMQAMVDEGNADGAALMAATRLSNSTQFRYPRAERGLAWQARAGARQTAPIATFWKGAVQNLYKDGVRPLLDWIGAETKYRAGKGAQPSGSQRSRALKAAKHLLMWYVGSLLINRIYEQIYDIDSGFYGTKTLRYVPGGPVLENLIRTTDAIWGAAKQERGWDYQLVSALDALGDFGIPFYHLANRTIGAAKGQEGYHFAREVRRVIKNWYTTRTTGMTPIDRRRWTDRNTLEIAQYLLLSGSWTPQKAEITDAYLQWAGEMDPDKAAEKKRALEQLLRKYPVSTQRREIPREAEFVPALVPNPTEP